MAAIINYNLSHPPSPEFILQSNCFLSLLECAFYLMVISDLLELFGVWKLIRHILNKAGKFIKYIMKRFKKC